MSSHSSNTRRTVRIGAAVVIAALVVFVAIGFIIPVVTVETASLTDRSPYVAFDVLTDPDRIDDWLDGFVSMELQLDRDEAVGNTSLLRIRSGRDTLEMSQEVIEWEPGERFTISFVSDMTTGSIETQLIQVENGTELFVRSRFEGSSWLWRSIFPIMRSGIRSTQQADYDRLAALINSVPTPIEGDWAGVDAEGNEQLFSFGSQGRLDWRAASEGEWFELDGLQYEVYRDADPIHIDLSGFSGWPLEGMMLCGIVEFVTDDSLRLDLVDAVPFCDEAARPDSFTDSTVELRRVR